MTYSTKVMGVENFETAGSGVYRTLQLASYVARPS